MSLDNAYLDIITNGDMSANITSSDIPLDFKSGFSVQAVFTGAPDGSFKMQVSNDDTASPTNWSDVTGSSQAITAAGDIMWVYDGAHFKWARIVFTFSSGTGTCNAKAVKKVIKHG